MSNMKDIERLRARLAVRHKEGEYWRCAYIGEKLVGMQKKRRNTHTMGFADDLFNLALAYEETGRLGKAIDAYAYSLRVTESLSGKGLEYAMRLTNLGIASAKKSENTDSMDILAQAEDIIRKTKGKNHPEAIDALYNYANSLFDAGLYDEALKMHSGALARKRSHKEDLFLADSLNSCGYCLEALDRPDEAGKYFAEAMEITERAKGVSSEEYISVALYYAGFLSKNNYTEDAVKLYRKCALLVKKTFSHSNICYAGILNYMSDALEKSGEIRKALAARLKALGIMEKFLGVNHLYFADALRDIALGYRKLGDSESAVKAIKRALRIKEAIFGRGNSGYISDMLLLLRFYLDERDYTNISKVLRDALKNADPNDPETPQVYSRLRDLSVLAGETAKAQRAAKPDDPQEPEGQTDRQKVETMGGLLKELHNSLNE